MIWTEFADDADLYELATSHAVAESLANSVYWDVCPSRGGRLPPRPA
jgi:hypothetical protein